MHLVDEFLLEDINKDEDTSIEKDFFIFVNDFNDLLAIADAIESKSVQKDYYGNLVSLLRKDAQMHKKCSTIDFDLKWKDVIAVIKEIKSVLPSAFVAVYFGVYTYGDGEYLAAWSKSNEKSVHEADIDIDGVEELENFERFFNTRDLQNQSYVDKWISIVERYQK